MSEIITLEENKVDVIMSREQAQELTDDIQSTTSALYVLLKRAHDDKAWVALGYKSWGEYIENEFEFSRARSYQLINQANVIEEINDASGVPVYLTEREARAIKKRLPEITEKLKTDVKEANLDDEDAQARARAILDEARAEEDDYARTREVDNGEGEDGAREPKPASLEDDVEEYVPTGDFAKKELSDDNQFYLDNLFVTFKIFESMPDASKFGKTVKYSTHGTKELKKHAENAFAWITQLLDEIE